MIKKDGLQVAAEERQRQSKEFRAEAARQSIPKRWTNNGKAPALGRSQPNPGHDQITVLTERRDLRPDRDDTGHRAPLDKPGPGLQEHEHQDLNWLPMHTCRRAVRLCILSQCSSARMNSDICPNLGIPPISRAAAFGTDCS